LAGGYWPPPEPAFSRPRPVLERGEQLPWHVNGEFFERPNRAQT